MRKTFIELELMGIVSMFRNDIDLIIITKDGGYWIYDIESKIFDLRIIL